MDKKAGAYIRNSFFVNVFPKKVISYHLPIFILFVIIGILLVVSFADSAVKTVCDSSCSKVLIL